jgi:hypothetical protein
MNPNNGRLDLGWLDVALCAHNPDLGWLKDPHLVGLGEEATMSVICSRCPVLAECEAYVEVADVTGGFWAGHHRTPDGPLLTFAPSVAGDAA